MTARLLMCCALLACGTASARPLVIESHKQVPLYTGFLSHYGNELFAVFQQGDYTGPTPVYTYSARIYTRSSSGSWELTSTLASETSGQYLQRSTVAINSSFAAVVMPGGLRVFERTAGGW